MNAVSQEAMHITMELNTSYHTPEEIRELFSRLTGKNVDDSFSMFPPFYTDCGKNIEVGKHVFINSGCRFQDQGGIRIADGAFIGHNVVLATLNHDFSPDRRAALYPASIHIGRNVWIGANATVLPGGTVGDLLRLSPTPYFKGFFLHKTPFLSAVLYVLFCLSSLVLQKVLQKPIWNCNQWLLSAVMIF